MRDVGVICQVGIYSEQFRTTVSMRPPPFFQYLTNSINVLFFISQNQEHLKPQLVHSLSNAELYCMALSNIYTDPNYHNLNHWGILRALNNKGIYPDKRLTETVLIQTNPLKLVSSFLSNQIPL